MAGTTKYKLSEQVLRLLQSGDPSVAKRVHIDELKAAVQSVINSLLKTEYVSETLAGDERIPEGCVMATYDNIVPISYKGVSKCTLPAMPVKLLRNMGVWHVSDTNNINDPFIPIQSGQLAMINRQPLINDILNQTGYEVSGADLIFTRDITLLPVPVVLLYIKLVIMDISQYSDYSLLPIAADMEWKVITEVYKMFSTEKPVQVLDEVKMGQGGQ